MFVAGTKRSVPSGLTVTVPCAGFASVGWLTVSTSPSVSRSLPSTAMSTGWLIGVEAMSSPATGGSFTGVTASVSVAVEVSSPSVAV